MGETGGEERIWQVSGKSKCERQTPKLSRNENSAVLTLRKIGVPAEGSSFFVPFVIECVLLLCFMLVVEGLLMVVLVFMFRCSNYELVSNTFRRRSSSLH